MAKGKNAATGISRFDDSKWQTEDDLRTLQRAQEIRNDAVRFKRAKDLAKEKLADMAKIASEGK
jgi:hypothetical protein